METQFDITIIGSGPGGYSAAIRASQLGFKVALIEKYDTLGGTCTNVGCIPSKALLDSTEHYHQAITKFDKHGIEVAGIKLNFEQLMKRKNDVVKQNTSGLNFLMKKNNIQTIHGKASFKTNHQLVIEKINGEKEFVTSRYIVIATGSKPAALDGVVIDKQRIISSTEALALTQKPKSMMVIGGGVIGVEMASIFSRIGVKVTIIEFADSIIPTMDKDLAKELKKILLKEGIDIKLKHRVLSAINNGTEVTLNYRNEDGIEENLTADYCLVAVGRKPYTEGLEIKNTSVVLDEKGRIKTNEVLQTNAENIYAIGDVISGPMLAHKAEEDGVFVAEIIHGQKPHLNYHLIPNVVYAWPEVASVGYTEEQLIQKAINYRVGKFPFSASGRARAAMEPDGFVKVLSDAKYGELLGVHVIGPRAADLIAQAVTGMHYETTDEDMFRMSYAHPTYSEALKEAYLQASGQGSLNI